MTKKVVVISGGNGSFISINALKPFAEKISLSAVIPMSDSGGSSGRLREEFGVLPAGDILRAVLAMSSYDSEMLKTVFYGTRFSVEGKLEGHNLGNLFLILAEQYSGSFIQSLHALHESLNTVGEVYPASLQKTDLVAELEDGQKLVGEHNIDRPKLGQAIRIKKVRLNPEVQVFQEAKQVLLSADIILLGPGSLYCSVIAGLLPSGVQEAINKNGNAKLVYISGSAYEKQGEVGPRTVSEAIEELEFYLPRRLDIIIHNNHILSKDEQDFYWQKGWGILEFDSSAASDKRIISTDYEKESGGLSYKKLHIILESLIS
ncbi:MAG: gluconeogenesis factor YvcK family protein [Candidatus Magasanikbacteria bacterium]